MLLSSLPGAAPAQEPASLVKVRAWLDENVPERMREAQLPGFSLAFGAGGRTVYAQGYGARDPKTNLPATADTLYGIGSVTKSFVAIAILQLAEQGKLSLDDPVARHVPWSWGCRETRSRSATF